jgi:SEFIR domain
VTDPPKVFISYTHDSNEHADRVLHLANQLRRDGIDADVDQYHHSPPEGWPRWMDRRIIWADFVFVVSTSAYLARVMGTEEPGKGLGVRWEGHLIYQHLYNAGTNNEKFIPIVFSKSDTKYIPTPLQGSTHYWICETQNDYPILLDRCRGLPRNKKPPLGIVEPLEEKERKTDVGMFFTSFVDPSLWDKARWSGCVFIHDKHLREPPVLGLFFKNRAPAEEIFKEWRRRLGELDSYNELRVSIIEGDVSDRPPGGYSVHIGSNIDNIFKRADDEGIDLPTPYVATISRMHYMTPAAGSTNLSFFRKRFAQFGSYRLMPVIPEGDSFVQGEGVAIHKRHIEFRNVFDIKDRNDIDSVVIPEFRKHDQTSGTEKGDTR